jgi:hypothetical protein
MDQPTPHNIDPDTGVCECDYCEYVYAMNQRNIYSRLYHQSYTFMLDLVVNVDYRNMIFWANQMSYLEDRIAG